MSLEEQIRTTIKEAVTAALSNLTTNTESEVDYGNIETYGTEEVAEILRVSIPTARKIMHRADFPLIKAGKNLRVSRQGLIKWTLERRV